jgi:acyl transferase domain-containing protein
MARAAIEQAWPAQPDATTLELHNTVWLRPVMVTEHKQVSIALLVNDEDQVGYEIYSEETEQRMIHCQGEAVFSRHPAPAKVDLEQIKGQMEQGKLESSNIYAMLAKMGLSYGPGHQGIIAIYLGENQLLAQLRLPKVVEAGQDQYVLHPSLMDSALQASIGLIVDLNHIPSKPSLPFVLKSVRMISACTKEMAAWVRCSEGSTLGDKIIKLDIDLCDQQGNVCVQMRGLSSRVLESEMKPVHEKTNNLTYRRSDFVEDGAAFDVAFYQQLIADVLNHEISADQAAELG